MARILDAHTGTRRRSVIGATNVLGSRLTGLRLTGLRLAGVGLIGLTLAGCSAAPDDPAGTPTQTAVETPDTSAAPAAPEDAAPALVADGTAADNLGYFDSVIAAMLATEPNPVGRSYIDALVAAGFDKSAMEVTSDTTTKGVPVDSIQFSVRITDECIVGQNGPSSGGYHSIVAPTLATGTCLVGATRQIDW
ncbi:hypothetical protein [Cryobacterium sp. PAMC25264]|uniref:DUF6993 domain-containing protein n=1 Tax=Cryobacterium sp. PAMC25264 TaxID=2861288 RepID=UPI002103122C|nr:hypothetical protein [Cryobacterium sp. PAMC25264]